MDSFCAHCGLPVRGGGEPVYCCNGCAIMAAVLAPARGEGEAATRGLVLKVGLAAFFSANVMVLSLFLYSGTPAPPAAAALIRVLLLGFSLPVFLILAPPFLSGLVRDLRRLRFSLDSLIALGSGAAFLYSAAAVLRGRGEVYFDTAGMVLLLVTLGRLFEAHAHVRGRRALGELLEAQPPEARVWREGEWRSVPASAVETAERVRVLPGERIPVDGVIARGASAVDESMLTGEPAPAERNEGEAVRAGTLCLNGALEIACTAPAAASLAARIVAAVEEAQRARSPLETMADRVAAVLAPFTVALAAVVVWQRGWLTGLSVLVVACPCAVGIAVPLVNVTALAAAARRGILVRSAAALDALARIDTMVFDKTGTITGGRLEVREIVPLGEASGAEVLAAAASAAAGSAHPVSRAVSAMAHREGVAVEPSRRTEELPGRGLRAELESGRRVLLGQPHWVAEETGTPPETREGVLCAVEGRLAGLLLLDDPVPPEAAPGVAALRHLGLRLALLSGDRPEAVARAAAALGIAEHEGALLPGDKAARIAAMRVAGRRVAMVGDGINDAPALAAADAGIAASGGADTAREVAQVVLLEPGLAKLAELVRLARLARRMGRRNLAWTFAYNGVALALAASGALRPVFAAALMLASSLAVVANALRLPARLVPFRHRES